MQGSLTLQMFLFSVNKFLEQLLCKPSKRVEHIFMKRDWEKGVPKPNVVNRLDDDNVVVYALLLISMMRWLSTDHKTSSYLL